MPSTLSPEPVSCKAPPDSDYVDLPQIGRVYCDPRSREEIEFIHREIFIEEDYRKHGIRFAPGQTIVDAGANVGLFSLYANQRCGRQATIYALEPAPRTFEYLVKNAAEDERLSGPHVHLLPIGLTCFGGPTHARLTVYPRMPGNSTLDPTAKRTELASFVDRSLEALARDNPRGYPFLGPLLRRELEAMAQSEEVECKLVTLTALCDAERIERIDLLKIDTEGAELDVVGGIDDDTLARVAQIVLETATKERAAALTERLSAAGFGSIVLESPDWARGLGLENHYLYATR